MTNSHISSASVSIFSAIELRTKTKASHDEVEQGQEALKNARPGFLGQRLKMVQRLEASPHAFGNIEDYGDDWRDEKTGVIQLS